MTNDLVCCPNYTLHTDNLLVQLHVHGCSKALVEIAACLLQSNASFPSYILIQDLLLLFSVPGYVQLLICFQITFGLLISKHVPDHSQIN